MLKGIKIRIYPTPEQERYISNLVGSCRFVYNSIVDYYDTVFADLKRAPKCKEAYAHFKTLRDNYGFLKEVHSKVVSNERCIVMDAFAHFFYALKQPRLPSGHLRFEKPQHHHRRKNDSCHFDRQAFRYIRGNRISLVKKLSNILFKCSRDDEIYLNHHQKRIKSITLRRLCSGKYQCSILIDDLRIKPLLEAPLGDIGIDVGVKDIIVTSDGEKVQNPTILKKYVRRLKLLEKRLSRCTIGSKRRNKARLRLARIHEKIANVRDDFQHQETKRLVSQHQGIYIEELMVTKLLQSINASKEFGDAALGSLLDKFTYKSQWYGRKFWKVSTFFPSTKKCHICGHVNDDLTLDDREWTCPKCGTHHDRDINAAKNILLEGRNPTVGLDSPEPNARGQVNIGQKTYQVVCEMPWRRRESKCLTEVHSSATES